MTRSNVIPFRRRPPSTPELEAYRWMTRSWSPGMRRLMCPQYYAWAEQPTLGAQSLPTPKSA
jgi:hypothetical protein